MRLPCATQDWRCFVIAVCMCESMQYVDYERQSSSALQTWGHKEVADAPSVIALSAALHLVGRFDGMALEAALLILHDVLHLRTIHKKQHFTATTGAHLMNASPVQTEHMRCLWHAPSAMPHDACTLVPTWPCRTVAKIGATAHQTLLRTMLPALHAHATKHGAPHRKSTGGHHHVCRLPPALASTLAAV